MHGIKSQWVDPTDNAKTNTTSLMGGPAESVVGALECGALHLELHLEQL